MSDLMELTEDNFDEVVGSADVPVIVDFWASWCGPCRALAPELARLAEAAGDRAVFAGVDVDAAPGLANRFGVQSVPTVMVFRDGEPAERSTGAAPAAVLAATLDIETLTS